MTVADTKQVGAQLRAARKLAGMSQRELSTALEDRGVMMHYTAISRVETGERELGYREALLLRQIIGFGVELADPQVFADAAVYRRLKETLLEVLG